MHKEPTEIPRVLLNSVVQRLYLGLVKESQHPLFQCSAPFAGNDLDLARANPNRLVDDVTKRRVNITPLVIYLMEVEFQASQRPTPQDWAADARFSKWRDRDGVNSRRRGLAERRTFPAGWFTGASPTTKRPEELRTPPPLSQDLGSRRALRHTHRNLPRLAKDVDRVLVNLAGADGKRSTRTRTKQESRADHFDRKIEIFAPIL